MVGTETDASPEVGDQEHEVLRAVWALGSCTVRQVHERVGESRGLAYTTTSTVLDRLWKKGLVARERDGKVLLYRGARLESVVEGARVRGLVDRILGSDPTPAVARLVDAVEDIDPALLDKLRHEIGRRQKARRGPR